MALEAVAKYSYCGSKLDPNSISLHLGEQVWVLGLSEDEAWATIETITGRQGIVAAAALTIFEPSREVSPLGSQWSEVEERSIGASAAELRSADQAAPFASTGDPSELVSGLRDVTPSVSPAHRGAAGLPLHFAGNGDSNKLLAAECAGGIPSGHSPAGASPNSKKSASPVRAKIERVASALPEGCFSQCLRGLAQVARCSAATAGAGVIAWVVIHL
mmetsp:Transcript_59956/g.126937  ORF Transcript_59956/g.126937 Transcript_59956/m.126937 type:complete len:217 (-) Transcript_59956:56-706(-)